MNDIIHLLPDVVANQIAAGEVIQRPASVIKELVENAIDAGADKIDVAVVDAGKTSIQVVDNGKGMSETDARLSFERHATSKISQASDLFALHTMGFRGEALASIAAVAQINLKTRMHDSDIGTELNVANSKVISQEAASCPPGSNFQVKNLFYNVPARRRFLKANATELNNIIAAFEKMVLVYPDITFSLYSNETRIFHLPACSLRQRILDVAGKKADQYLLPVNVNTTLVKIKGFVGKPESARKKGADEFFFVNGRYMRHPFFHKAVMAAYERLIPNGDQIPYFIYMEVDPNEIDVNIHPTKAEIKFDNEHSIFQILLAGVREALGTFCQIPELEFTQEQPLEIPTYCPSPSTMPAADGHTQQMAMPVQQPVTHTNPSYNPFSNPRPQVPRQWEKLYSSPAQPVEQDLAPAFFEEKSPEHYQYKGSYIMTAIKSGLMIIDQHRAHVRIIFESLMNKKHDMRTQKVLFPEIIELTPSEAMLFSKIKSDMEDIGFEVADMGGGAYSVNGIPSGLKDVSAIRLLQNILSSAKDGHINLKDDYLFNICLTVARSAAVAKGQILSDEEMDSIVNKLFICDNPNYTPDGKPVLTIIKQSDIESHF